MRSLLCSLAGIVLVLLAARPLVAQSEPIVSWEVGIFAAGQDPNSGGTPTGALVTYPVAAATCGQAKINPPATVENPIELRLDDPGNAALDCVIPSASTQLAAVPLGTGYRIFIRTKGATSQVWSVLPSNPFARVGTGPVRPATGVRVRKAGS